MAVVLPNGRNYFATATGAPGVGYKLYAFVPGTSTPKDTYTTSAASVANAHPVVANSRGEMTIYWVGSYDVVLKDSADITIWGPERLEDSAGNLETDLADSSSASLGDALVAYKRTDSGAVASTLHAWHEKQIFDARTDFGAACNGSTDDTSALNSAITAAALVRGIVRWIGTLKVTSQIVLPAGVKIVGHGCTSDAAIQGATCLLRAFTGTNATLLVSGDDAGADQLDVDNNVQGTGECIQVTGSRAWFGRVSVHDSGGDGFRIGKTEAGASSINANFWHIGFLATISNAGAGLRIDHTNTSTSLSYPLGAPDVNAGTCVHLDARANGTDGLQLGNCQDNVFLMVGSQSNTGCGIRFKTDGTNWGPRANKIVSNDSEGNTGNDIQIDAGTLPAAAPGGYNIVLGNRSIAVASRIVDNSTGSLVVEWDPGNTYRSYHFGSDVNAKATSGQVGFNAYVGANAAVSRLYAVASGTVDSIMRGAVRKNGAGLTDAWEANQHAIFQPLNDHIAVTYSTSITINAATGHQFQINATDGVAFTINAPTNPTTGQRILIQIRNTSGVALGAITWDAAFKMPTFTAPATGFSRTVAAFYNGANWIVWQISTADVPN